MIAANSQVVEADNDYSSPILHRQESAKGSQSANPSTMKTPSRTNAMSTSSIKEKTQSYGEKLRKQFGSKKTSSSKGGFSSTQKRLPDVSSPLIQPPPKIVQSKIIINLLSK